MFSVSAFTAVDSRAVSEDVIKWGKKRQVGSILQSRRTVDSMQAVIPLKTPMMLATSHISEGRMGINLTAVQLHPAAEKLSIQVAPHIRVSLVLIFHRILGSQPVL